jgi:hypothetical protein
MDAGSPHSPKGTFAMKIVPQELRVASRDAMDLKMVSTREMLRYYFEAHPDDYEGALAAALGISVDDEHDLVYLQERLAYALARVGSFVLAEKMLAALKAKKKMDVKKCLLELGYAYDPIKKRLVVGKRVCGNPKVSSGIVGLIPGTLKKKVYPA